MTNIVDRIQTLSSPKRKPGESQQARDARRRESELFHQSKDAMESFGNMLNGGSKSVVMAGMVEGLARQHRYLQQQTIITLLTALGEFGGLPAERYTDARNEFAHKLCKLLRERFRDELFWKDGE